jgi:hypothetical protein
MVEIRSNMSKQDRKRIEARVVLRKKAAVLLEANDKDGIPLRATFPAESLSIRENGTVILSEEEFSMGIPFGIPWEYKFKQIVVTPEELAGELHRNGIWTRDDVYKNPEGVKGALLASMKLSLAYINQIAKESIPTEED